MSSLTLSDVAENVRHKYERDTSPNRCAYGQMCASEYACVYFPLCNPCVQRGCSICMQIKRTVPIVSFALYAGYAILYTRDVRLIDFGRIDDLRCAWLGGNVAPMGLRICTLK